MQRIVVVLAFLTYCPYYSLGVKSSCMAPPVKSGDEATLTCHFEKDISKIQQDVLVYLYKENTEQPVLIYSWQNGKANVLTMGGYRYEGNISDYLVINIASVNENNAGQYSCLVAMSKDESTACTLRIIESPLDLSDVAVVKAPNMIHDTLSQQRMGSFPVTEPQIQMLFAEHPVSEANTLYIAAIVLGVLFGVLIIIFLTILITAICKGWIPICCSTEKQHDSLTGNSIKNGNLTYIYKSQPIYTGSINMERDLKQKLVEPA